MVATRRRWPWPRAELGRRGVEVGHVGDVDPEGGDGDDEVGEAEAHRRELRDALGPARDLLADEVLAGDAEVEAAGGELARDLGGGEELELDAVDAARRCRGTRGRRRRGRW